MTGVLYFSYHIFDILDGKHARRTGMSSSLGLLMDHGVDALVTFLFTMSLGSVIKLSGPIWYVLLWLMVSVTFFFNTWEEYETDVLDFPIINGVSEGTLFAVATCISTAFLGQDFWLQTYDFYGLYKYNQLMVLGAFSISLLFSVYSVIKVIFSGHPVNLFRTFSNTVIFNFFAFTLFIVINYSNSSIIVDCPKLVLYMYGFCFAKIVVIFFKYIFRGSYS